MSKPTTLATLTSHNEGYDELERQIARYGTEVMGKPLFTTNACGRTDEGGLYDVFLSNLPAHRRQHYTCHCCRRFVDAYGGLVTINEAGVAEPVFFERVSAGPGSIFLPALTELRKVVRAAEVLAPTDGRAPATRAGRY